MDDTKMPYDIERRSFDPEILNFTLKTLQKSIDTLKLDSGEKLKELQGLIIEVKKECHKKNEEISRVDKEFSICRAAGDAARHSEEKTHGKRNTMLFNVITIMLAVIALIISISNTIRYIILE